MIKKSNGKFRFRCSQCNKHNKYATRFYAELAVRRGNCKNCFKRNRVKKVEDSFSGMIFSNNGRWAVNCPTCHSIRQYRRLDHARATLLSGRNCRKCTRIIRSAKEDLYRENIRISIFKKFKRSAIDRGLTWDLDISHVIGLWGTQIGRCALSGITLSDKKTEETYSLDRIDSSKGYFPDNVQLVHKTINMMKGSLSDDDFRMWCRRVARCRMKSA